MCTVCPVLHCIGNHLNALHSFDHLNEFYPMASSNSEPSGEGNHNDDAEEEADDVSKCRIKPSIVDTNLSENPIKRRRQFYYNHVRSIYSQILSKKIATKRKSSSTCKPALLLTCSNLWKSLIEVYFRLRQCCETHPKLLTTVLPVSFSLFIYINSIFGDFVHDDLSAIVRNPDVTGVTSISNIFANDFWGTPMSSIHSHKSYRPITILVFGMNYGLCNGKSFCFHGTNILLHGCATFLISQMCMRVLHLDFFTTFVANIVFALHPIHTEAVSGLVGCADLLACNFTLLSFLAYNRYLTSPRNAKWHLMSLLAASFAVLSKETGITAFGINILFGASKLFLHTSKSAKEVSKSAKVAVKRISTDAFMMAFLLLCRILIQDSSLPHFTSQDNPAAFHTSILTRTLTFLYLPVLNFWLLLCPFWLSYDWQMGSIPLVNSFKDSRFLAIVGFYSLLALLTISIFRKLYSGRHLIRSSSNKMVMGIKFRTLIAAILFMVLPFLPASNLLFPVGFVLAERILYLPSVGYSLLFAIGFQTFVQKVCPLPIRKHPARRLIRKQQGVIPGRIILGERKHEYVTSFDDERNGTPERRQMKFDIRSSLAYVLLGILCITFASKTLIRNQDWVSRSSLFRSGLKTVPSNAKVQYNFANVMKEDGKLDLATKHYEEALRLWPNYVLAHNNLATLLSDKSKAEWHLRRALNIDPWHSNSLYNLAVLLSNRHLCSEAIGLLERCIVEDPGHERALLLLSDCLIETKSEKSSLETMADTLTITLKKEDIPAAIPRVNKTETKQQIHKFADLTRRPFLNFGSSVQEMVFGQDSDDGSKWSKQSDDIARKDGSKGQKRTSSLLSHLAEAYIRVSKWSKAESLLQKILESQPSHQVALYQISQVYLEQNKTALALTSIHKAKEHCKNFESFSNKQQFETSRPCLWGSRCIPRDRICTGILIQEADILREMGYFKMAANNYRIVLDIAPHEPRLLLSLGSIHHVLGEWEMAWHYYGRCFKLQPDNTVLIANMKLLEKNSQKQIMK